MALSVPSKSLMCAGTMARLMPSKVSAQDCLSINTTIKPRNLSIANLIRVLIDTKCVNEAGEEYDLNYERRYAELATYISRDVMEILTVVT